LPESATYISVGDRIKIETGRENVARVKGGPLDIPNEPSPAKRVTNPEESIFLIRLLPVSQIYRFPLESIAIS
jgi:hypothetical protein